MTQEAPDRATVHEAGGRGMVRLDAHGFALKAVTNSLNRTGGVGGPNLPYGLFGFDVSGLTQGGIATVDLTLPPSAKPGAYYKQDAATGTLTRFDFDGTTGAVVRGNKVSLYLQDGGRGDADGVANGVVVDPGGPGGIDPPPPPGGGGPGSTSGAAVIEVDDDWIYRGDTVTFDVYSTADPPPTYVQIEWDFNYDGVTFHPDAASGDTVDHAFSSNGTFTVAARLTTETGTTELASTTVTVHHLPPSLAAPDVEDVTAGDTVNLDVTGSAEASIQSVEWWVSFDGEDYEFDPTITGLSMNYLFDHFGTYDFWVVATDVDGEVGECQFEVYADPAGPTGRVTVTGPIDEGQSVTFSVADIDPDTTDDVSIYADWTGTGNFALVPSDEWALGAYVNGVATFSHTYHDGVASGHFTAQIRVEEEGGLNNVYPVDVQVRDVPPTATLTAGDPGLENRGWKVTDTAYSGQEVWAISQSAPVGFFNVTEPSAADRASEVFHFVVTPDTPDGTGDLGPGTQTDSSDPWVDLPGYDVGRSYRVEGWITDKDGVETPHQKINVTMVGTVDGEPAGTSAVQSPVYGTMKVPGSELPASYNRYGYAPEIKTDLGVGDPLTVELIPDRYGQAMVNAGATIKFLFQVTEDHNTTFGVETETLDTVEQSSGTYTVPFVYPEDYRITVTGWFNLIKPDGQVVNGGDYYQVVAKTPTTKTWIDQINELVLAVQQIAQDFGDRAPRVVDAILNHTGSFFNALVGGFSGAASQIISELTTTPLLLDALYKFIGTGITLPPGFDPTNTQQLTDFLLQYAGLTWDHVSNVIMQELGNGNVAAVSAVAAWLGNLTDENITGPGAMQQLVANLAGQVDGITVDGIVTGAVSAARDEIAKGMTNALPEFLAKMVPGGGQLVTIVRGLGWLLDNREHLMDVYNQLMGPGMDALLNFDAGAFQTALVNGFHIALPTAIGFLAGQIGLGHLPQDVRKALSYIPRTVDQKMREAIRNIAKNAFNGGTKGGRNDGLLGSHKPKTFPFQNKQFQLWETKESKQVYIKISDGSKIWVVSAKDFLPPAQIDFGNVAAGAETLAGARRPKTGPAVGPTQIKNLGITTEANLDAAEGSLIQDIQNGLCKIFGGCFAAGTKLSTPAGYRNVEEIQTGDLVLSRNEFDPAGQIEAKVVEQVFVRFAPVVHLHVGGQVVRTTGEHPFFAYEKGWTAAVDLAEGDWVLTAGGEWRAVEEAYPTDRWEPVYNVRVADHHTYFVGDYGWGWALWAHNRCEIVLPRRQAIFVDPDTGIRTERGERLGVRNTDNGYNSAWFKPRSTDDKALLDDACDDSRFGIGNQLQAQVTAFAAAWRALPADSTDKYTADQKAAIEAKLLDINAIRARYNLSPVDENDFLSGGSISQLPSSASQADKDAYGKLLRSVNSMRAAAEGIYVHNRMKDYCRVNGYGWSDTGIDITVAPAAGRTRTLRYEVLRDTDGSWNAHYRDTMVGADWRALTYV